MKIVILDHYAVNPGDVNDSCFKELGEVVIYDNTSHKDVKEIINRIGDAQAVITNKVPITREVLDGCPNLEYIGVIATGYNIIDLKATKEKNIVVTNIPDYGTLATAQHAIALLLEITNRVGIHSTAVAQGRWERNELFCFWDIPLTELSGKTLGIIGYGRIGKATARIASALGMKILAYSPSQKPSEENVEFVSLDDIYANSHVISLHCPLFPETEKLINKATLDKMKDGVILINAARGGLIDEKALADALDSGKVSAAGIDVLSTEPPSPDNPLLKAKNCYITPHTAWAPTEARQRLIDLSMDNLRAYKSSNPINVVNK